MGSWPYGLNKNWGKYTGVFGANTDLLSPTGFDATSQRILYSVPTTFGSQGVVGTNLLLQFQAQLGLKFTF